jgi:hypothetical protein
MKNLIRFFGFALALFLTTSLSAQSNWAPTGSKTTGTDPNGGLVTASGAQQYDSTMDNAVIDVVAGAEARYAVYIQKIPDQEWQFVQSGMITGTASTQDLVINQPGSYGLRVVLATCASCGTVTFSN